jgi:hypothetical protein
MDEMIYNLDIIMKKIEIKNEELALKYESEESITVSDTLMSIEIGNIRFDTFPFTEEILLAYGYDLTLASKYSLDKYLIPEKDRDSVFNFACRYFEENYEEKNNYYRSLIGLPWIDENLPEDTYYVYLDESYITDKTVRDVFDFSIPLHEYESYQIAVLNTTGIMDKIYANYSAKQYKYIHFLGDTKMDVYYVRKATKWDILYMPNVETLVSDRFKELYQINKTLYLKRFYSQAYEASSDYYDEFMIIMLLCQTYTDMIADIPEWYVRRDVFDLRSCQYFLESNGIEFFDEIPLKYQIKLVKNINKLIRYKSTNQNIWDIIDIFGVDATVYKYYLFKQRIANDKGSYATGQEPSDAYELKFIKAPIGESYDDSIKSKTLISDYDDITLLDKYWDGEDDHEEVKNAHLAKDFTIEGTKFITLENKVSINDYSFQLEYFFGLIMDSDMHMSDIVINIPTISSMISFPISDLFILLHCLTGSYDDYRVLIRTPRDVTNNTATEFELYQEYDGGYVYTNKAEIDLFGGSPGIDQDYMFGVDGGNHPKYTTLNEESFYEWLRCKYPNMWIDMTARVYGFNMKADLKWLAEVVSFRHSNFHFQKGYTLEELGVSGYITTTNITTLDDLMKVYETNSTIHDNLLDKIVNADSRDQKVVYQFVFDYLFTRKFDYDRYTLKATGQLAESYDEVLKEKNYVLYEYYLSVTSEIDKETRQDQIRSAMNDIVNTLDYYLSYDSLNHIFSVFTTSSYTNILHYIYLVVNFFKSYKVHFLDTYVTFQTDNKLDNYLNITDNVKEYCLDYLRPDQLFIRDNNKLVLDTKYTKADSLGIRDTAITTFDTSKIDRMIIKDLMLPTALYESKEKVSHRDRLGDIDTSLDFEDSLAYQYKETLDIYGYYEPDPTIDMNLDGGEVSTTYDESSDIDGGGVTLKASAPFITYNGGEQGIELALFDLDGGSTQDAIETVDIDGGGTEEWEDTQLANNTLSYVIDGGVPNLHHYYTTTMATDINVNKLSLSVRVESQYHGRYNTLVILDDGLAILDNWMSETRYAIIESNLETLYDDIDKFKVTYDNFTKDLEETNTRVNTVVDDYFKDPVNAMNNFSWDSAKTLNTNKSYTDQKSRQLYDYWKNYINSKY